jgi:hypothetical protein
MKQKAADKKKSSKDLKERIHQHLADKNDVITDEDLKNINVGDAAFKKKNTETGKELEQGLKEEKNLADAIEEKKITSPWTILSEEDK